MRRLPGALLAGGLAVAFVTLTAHGLAIRGPSAQCDHGSAHSRHECRSSLLPASYPVSRMSRMQIDFVQSWIVAGIHPHCCLGIRTPVAVWDTTCTVARAASRR